MLAKLLKFNEEKFIQLYLERYGKEWEDFVTCANRCIEQWVDEIENFEEWQDMVAQCLPKNSSRKVYKSRNWWNETVLQKAANSLWLEVWPKFNLK